MGWSDLTELQRRQHIINLAIKVKDYHVQLKGASLAGICRYVIFLHEFTLKSVYLFYRIL